MRLGKRCVAIAAYAALVACNANQSQTPTATERPAPSSDASDASDAAPAPPPPCASTLYPAAPADTTLVRYVASCTIDSNAPLGTPAHPYPTILASLEGIGARTTIVIAPGSYDGPLRLTQTGTRLWASSGERAEDAIAIIRNASAGGPLVSIDGAADVVVQGLRIEDAPHTGIAIRGGSAAIRGSAIVRAKGHGIDASDAAIIFQHNAVEGAGTVGIIFQNVSGIIFQNTVRGAGTAGMVASGPKLGDLSIRENHLLGNAQLGLGVYGLDGIVVEGNDVSDTAAHATLGGGDGIVIGNLTTPPLQSSVELRKNVVERSARSGIIFQNQPNAIIFQNQVRKSGAGGIRVQGGSAASITDVVRLDANVLEDNAGFGIAMSGGRAIIFQNQVRATSPTDFGLGNGTVADGVVLVTKAKGQRIEGNQISGSARVGMLLDGLDQSTVMSQNTLTQNALDLFTQNCTMKPAQVTNGAMNAEVGSDQISPPYYFPSTLPVVTDPVP